MKYQAVQVVEPFNIHHNASAVLLRNADVTSWELCDGLGDDTGAVWNSRCTMSASLPRKGNMFSWGPDNSLPNLPTQRRLEGLLSSDKSSHERMIR